MSGRKAFRWISVDRLKTVDKSFDVVVMGSGAAGLTAALVAAARGANVLVLEKAALVGGTSAISGGQLWIPNNRFIAPHGDSRRDALMYLAQVTLGETPHELLEAFVDSAAEMVAEVERLTSLRFAAVDRPDYHSEWEGARWSRSIEPLPLDTRELQAAASMVRRSPYRAPLTSAEIKAGGNPDLVEQRVRTQHVTQGAALVCGLVQGCLSAGVAIACNSPVDRLARMPDGAFAIAAGDHVVRSKSVVLASGGFEWDDRLKRAFLACPDEGAASPPANDGDGLRIALAAGAAVANMTQAWWSAAFRIPGETYEGRPLVRNMVRELALPGSILVNAGGRRFANEAASYNVLGKAFQAFDPQKNTYPNKRAWIIFDEDFKRRYAVAGIPADQPAPSWFARASSIGELATKAGIDPLRLEQTVTLFGAMARAGRDLDFGRGDARHDRYHSDPSQPHPNLGPISTSPFYAVPVFLGNLGTKGGVRTDSSGRVQSMNGTSIHGLYACGNVAASWMGPGYPGAGGSLGPIMTAAYLCGTAVAKESN
jgi:3-oxosteroid 1-dehydrogenase